MTKQRALSWRALASASQISRVAAAPIAPFDFGYKDALASLGSEVAVNSQE
ncbi:hypothetical protein [Bradyrhizobium icense]|uniref:hypothetical protein n=1 Tax=Bradyrhizobium icense TaxID=1274631 RepID=UPI0012EAEAC5|nr:hypothetical protein [Bradyrhizobium icense]